MKALEIINEIEKFAPKAYQESYDNSGLQIGQANSEVNSCIIALDCTEKLIDYAIDKKIDLVITHHPLIFSGLKSITGKNEQERIIAKAIKHDIIVYSAHTNLDSVTNGVSFELAKKLNLKNIEILDNAEGNLKKLVVFCPITHIEKVKYALFEAGAGNIGNYDQCSFSTQGKGSFRALEGSNPYVGEKNKCHFEEEERIETIFPAHKESSVLQALFQSHPYEEVAYDVYNLTNTNKQVGLGAIGTLEKEMTETEFFAFLSGITKCKSIRHSSFNGKSIKKVALCGGSGSHLIKKAKLKKADLFITGDIKYHAFAEAEDKIIIADIGHFESEQFTKELLFEIISKKFHNFAAYIYKEEENPVNYFPIK
ncbi:MAG: Nif3-like dinuclear metal center hexameric protein [Bacteroidota bacterium]